MESDDKKERESTWPSRMGQDWSELMTHATFEHLTPVFLCPHDPESGQRDHAEGEKGE